MKLIEELSEMIEDEIDGAEEYAEKAVELKAEHRKLADTLYELATEEMGHINRLHTEVVRLIEEYRKTSGDPPIAMMAVYDYLHKRHMERVAEIKRYQDIYKNA